MRAVPNTGKPLPIDCPKCGHDGCTLVVKSRTIMTVACPSCGHTWATEMKALPAEIQQKVLVVLRDLGA